MSHPIGVECEKGKTDTRNMAGNNKKGHTMKATGTNVFVLAKTVREDGTVPSRVPATDHRHLCRCLAAGLIENDDGTLRITAAGRDAIRDY